MNVELARQVLTACNEFREAAYQADQAIDRDGNTITQAGIDSLTRVIRKASTLDDLASKLASAVLASDS